MIDASAPWEQLRSELAFDGGLWDIHVAGSGFPTWETFLRELGRQPWPLRYHIDGVATSLPREARAVLEAAREGAASLDIRVGAVVVACHFFDEDHLELDADPREVVDAASFGDLLSFLRWLARTTASQVMLTPEGSPGTPLLVIRPGEDEPRLHG